MARPREFDEAAVLDAAAGCFWERGHEATSIRDLAAQMDISAPSLYDAFGDKRALFLDKRLSDREFVAGAYSVADMAAYPWIVPYERQGQKPDDFPNPKRWFEAIRERPAVKRAYARAKEVNTQPTVGEESKRILFGQSAASVGR